MATRTSQHPRRSRVHSMAYATTTLLLILLLSLFLAIPVVSQDNPPPLTAPGDPAVSSPADGTVDAPGAAPPPVSPATPSGTSWSGCVSPEGGFQPVTIGKPTTICLVLSNNGDWSSETNYMRLNFSPIADQYSRFHVPESFVQLVGTPKDGLKKIFPGNITAHSESQTA